MNRIFTLLTLVILCFALNEVKAQQITLSFGTEADVPTANCWDNTNISWKNPNSGGNGNGGGGNGNGNGNGGNNGGTPTNGSMVTQGFTSASLVSPFIDIPAGGTIRFRYMATDNVTNHTLVVRLISLTGNTVVSTLNNITNTTYALYTSPALAAGTYRVSLEYTSNATTQIGQKYIDIDDLVISGAYHYSDFCNSTPVGVADTYTAISFADPVVSGNVLANDTDPNTATHGETITVVSNTTAAAGTVTLNSDGNFTFTPNASFTGGPVTFTYTISDNGYAPLTSAPITVTINYPTAPVAIDDDLTGPPTTTSFTGNITGNDTRPAGKTLLAALVQAPTSGQVVIHADGTFTYTPGAGFVGGDVTFTYRVSYDTYLPLYSNAATVTLSYPEFIPTPLPIKLLSFNGQLANDKVQLNWLVDDNETGNYFKVEKSTDGRNFSEAALIFANGKSGKQEYSYTEPITTNKSTYYRLKIVNYDGPVAYSKTVLVKPQHATSSSTSLTLLTATTPSLLRFTFLADQQEPSTVSVYTLNGTKVLTQQLSTSKGLNYVELGTGSLPSGLYILEVNSPTTNRRTKFIK